MSAAPAGLVRGGVALESVSVRGRSTLVARGGSGPPLLYLHGLAGDMHASFQPSGWSPVLARLARQFSVLAPAHPGYPGSDGAASLDGVDDYAFHYADLLDVFGIDQAAVVGCSFGGWLATELAVRHPARVAKLALLDPLGVHGPGLVEPFFGAVAPRGVGGFGEARQLLFADPSSGPALVVLPDDMGETQQLRWYEGLAGAARLGWPAPQFQSRKLTSHLWRVGCPTLIVWGEHDRLVPPAHRRVWSDSIARCRTVTIAGAGHCLIAEHPHAVAAEVLAFLGS
jgi:pimeloyl-ACP methyl ester carboxylesterase